MSRASTWLNADGLRQGYGARDSKNENAATVRTQGNIEVWQFPIDYDTLATIGTAPVSKSIPIPANSTILRGQLQVTTAFAGGTNIDFGLMNSAGTAIDDDGLDSAVLTSAMTPANTIVTFDGALIGANVGTADAYFGTVVTGTYTAGAGIVTVEYVRPMPDSTPTDPISGIVGTL